MNLTIKESTPLKYHLNMHLLDSFIEMESIAFEVIKYVVNEVASNEKKELALDNLKFTSKTLKYVFGDKLKDIKFKEYTIFNLKKMIKDEWVVPKNKSMYITEKMISNFYNIK
jgi:hypothetical protein